jgi:signal peptidase I
VTWHHTPPLATAPSPVATRPLPRQARPSSPLKGALEWLAIIGGALIVALIIKATAVQAFYIPSESMVPTLKIGDRVLVNKLSYSGPLSHDINRGDIVVFERPPNESDPRVKDLIKRVIGLEGEEVSGHDGQVFIDGAPLDEPYLVQGTQTSDFAAVEVPVDHVWVMGDNRPNSRDSRFFGPIPDDLIVGRAFIRVWPLSSIRLL